MSFAVTVEAGSGGAASASANQPSSLPLPGWTYASGVHAAVVHGLGVTLEPLGPPHLDALVLVRFNRKHLEAERAFAVLFEQARVALACDDRVVHLMSGLLLEHFADDLLFAVPIREAIDVTTRARAQLVIALDPAARRVVVSLVHRRRRVFAIDLDREPLFVDRQCLSVGREHQRFDAIGRELLRLSQSGCGERERARPNAP
jgi:hypothetical protein